MGIFPDSQGQLTPPSLVGFGQISHSYVILGLSILPAKINTIRLKMKALQCSQHFLYYNPMEAFLCLKVWTDARMDAGSTPIL